MDELTKCCRILLKVLTELRDSGEITQEEYEKHIELKIKFLQAKKDWRHLDNL